MDAQVRQQLIEAGASAIADYADEDCVRELAEAVVDSLGISYNGHVVVGRVNTPGSWQPSFRIQAVEGE